jgi:nitrate reductase gamma subunit
MNNIKTEISKRNFKLGLSIIIVGFFTLILYPATIFIMIKLHSTILDPRGFAVAGFLGFMILVSGVLYLFSLILNIKESRSVSKLTNGMKLTLISTVPVVLCYTGIIIKALTEGH